jgi:hypothetical protein
MTCRTSPGIRQVYADIFKTFWEQVVSGHRPISGRCPLEHWNVCERCPADYKLIVSSIPAVIGRSPPAKTGHRADTGGAIQGPHRRCSFHKYARQRSYNRRSFCSTLIYKMPPKKGNSPPKSIYSEISLYIKYMSIYIYVHMYMHVYVNTYTYTHIYI